MLNQMKIGGKLMLLSAVLLVPLLFVAALATWGMGAIRQDVDRLFASQRTTLTIQRVLFLLAESRAQEALALQHNPQLEYSKQHGHPLAMHTDAVRKNHDEVLQLLQQVKAIGAGSESGLPIERWIDSTREFLDQGLSPTNQSLIAENYEQAMQDLLKKLNPRFNTANKEGSELLKSLESGSAKDKAAAENEYRRIRAIILAFAAVAVALGLLLAYLITRSTKQSVQRLVSASEAAVTSNDFTQQMPADGRDEMSRLGSAFNHLIDKLRTVVRETQSSSHGVAEAADTLSVASRQIAAESATQSDAAANVAASLEEISASVSETVVAAKEGEQLVSRAQAETRAASEGTQRAIAELGVVSTVVKQASDNVMQLSSSSAQIGGIVSVIREIADQTNLLALNAAIEAARAGEQGRGFAVVADEVRKLAERTSRSTSEISTLIGTIQTQVEHTVSGMREAEAQVACSAAAAEQAGKALESIAVDSQSVADHVHDIAGCVQSQDRAIRDMAESMVGIAQSAQSNGDAARNNSGTAEQLDQLAKELRDNAMRYRV